MSTKPPKKVRENACNALKLRASKPPSKRGMTPTGIARARDLCNGRNVSPKTAKRILSFLSRHEKDKRGKSWKDKGKGWQAWNGWGGNAAIAWVKRILGM
jgi:hypothetical protein